MSSDGKDKLRPEYSLEELGTPVRGKYYKRYRAGTNVVVIDPDLAGAFPNAEAVNDALRKVLAERQKQNR